MMCLVSTASPEEWKIQERGGGGGGGGGGLSDGSKSALFTSLSPSFSFPLFLSALTHTDLSCSMGLVSSTIRFNESDRDGAEICVGLSGMTDRETIARLVTRDGTAIGEHHT